MIYKITLLPLPWGSGHDKCGEDYSNTVYTRIYARRLSPTLLLFPLEWFHSKLDWITMNTHNHKLYCHLSCDHQATLLKTKKVYVFQLFHSYCRIPLNFHIILGPLTKIPIF